MRAYAATARPLTRQRYRVRESGATALARPSSHRAIPLPRDRSGRGPHTRRRGAELRGGSGPAASYAGVPVHARGAGGVEASDSDAPSSAGTARCGRDRRGSPSAGGRAAGRSPRRRASCGRLAQAVPPPRAPPTLSASGEPPGREPQSTAPRPQHRRTRQTLPEIRYSVPSHPARRAAVPPVERLSPLRFKGIPPASRAARVGYAPCRLGVRSRSANGPQAGAETAEAPGLAAGRLSAALPGRRGCLPEGSGWPAAVLCQEVGSEPSIRDFHA